MKKNMELENENSKCMNEFRQQRDEMKGEARQRRDETKDEARQQRDETKDEARQRRDETKGEAREHILCGNVKASSTCSSGGLRMMTRQHFFPYFNFYFHSFSSTRGFWCK